uniref:OCIA domain-containing protein 1 n=1 Tax=Takifugu rubripes TaxID=31033 RepID=A0A3B5JWN2_TAKRU
VTDLSTSGWWSTVVQAQVGIEYIPTEEERRVFRECNQESFWYRCKSRSSRCAQMNDTLGQIKGTLSASPRFGSLPKVVCKLSYMKTCQEKFKRLENSPLGEALRQRTGTSGAQSDLSDPDPQSFGPMFQPAEAGQKSYFTDAPVQMGRSEDFGAPGNYQGFKEEPRRKGILYEDLRLKNRENYEVMLSQKAETLHKTPPEKETRRPNKEVKNIYGDTWEE